MSLHPVRLCFAALALAAVSGMASAQSAPAAAAAPAVQSANILDIKDASSDPGYAEQNNAQRNQVQPGNNAPMWRQVGQGLTGHSSLPASQAPEAGNLIQPFVQYPGSTLTNAGEAWRQARNNLIIPYGRLFGDRVGCDRALLLGQRQHAFARCRDGASDRAFHPL